MALWFSVGPFSRVALAMSAGCSNIQEESGLNDKNK